MKIGSLKKIEENVKKSLPIQEISNSTERNSNIELLRILLIFMVITLHFNNSSMGGAFNLVKSNKLSFIILNFLESMSVCAVNCFMIISGYFLAFNKKVKFSKIIDLLLVVVLYQLLCYIIQGTFFSSNINIKGIVFSLIPFNYYCGN